MRWAEGWSGIVQVFMDHSKGHWLIWCSNLETKLIFLFLNIQAIPSKCSSLRKDSLFFFNHTMTLLELLKKIVLISRSPETNPVSPLLTKKMVVQEMNSMWCPFSLGCFAKRTTSVLLKVSLLKLVVTDGNI